jgi:hypothetical protein
MHQSSSVRLEAKTSEEARGTLKVLMIPCIHLSVVDYNQLNSKLAGQLCGRL